MEKVTLTKEQAEAIEIIKNLDDYQPAACVAEFLNGESVNWTTDLYNPLCKLSDDHFIRAIYVGYEVAKTAHEKVAEFWNLHDPDYSNDDFDKGVRYGVGAVLNIVGMKVKGVNS